MKYEPDLRRTPENCNEHVELIRHLAYKHFIQLKLGQHEDFNTLWLNAFGSQINDTQLILETGSCSN